ncbi:MAG: hypothetical protein PeribacterA2_0993 [Candidatus Peribacter riflensis]|uniref:Gcp-like domain-containing protein n=1 Tax=Candidatus Peribacter riflensis TaxID=1735162 RepID=A0A0S1SKE9_9BACT|nr:MAG: hypothetical protein PeribacterA2_0993 [Candidatus Peribacter riflensis]OGJ78459.1 MAG: hypothetical protein A2398_02335 [Candidatus Peribacteria bacterium RIFOXYB1_FULL_57_12]OGJ82114.1 MAG: hypothetical protein A2412_00110 [Candidatus Peribacteria bacterium RIFOXYC1_FULL_58_8]ALM11455.1 MAG: hypothetical protein PeribacterB2_0995 [Candidatus Peribacter riflensis]ALM12557.1 MAG: hypothetical protein PeribacterC2_0994 [Candidatus Peribacter riflensis]
MRCLFLDLASHSGLLACAEDRAIKASEPVDHRIGDHELILLFEKTLDAAGWKSGDLTHVACAIGPGGFMSLRVAVAFANTLIHQLHIPGAGIHLSDLTAARVQDAVDFLWLHSTKRHELFARGFGSYTSLWPEAVHLTVDDFIAKLPPSPFPLPEGGGMRNELFFVGELIPEHEALFKDRTTPASLRSLDDVLPEFLARQTFAPELLEPWYGRGW